MPRAKRSNVPPDAAAGPPPMPDIPTEVLRVITANVAGVFVARAERSRRFVVEMGSACEALRDLSLACRDMRSAVEEAGLWLRLLEAMNLRRGDGHRRDTKQALQLVRAGRIDARRALRLVGMTGCQLCGCARIRKVHWAFRVRCCKPCLRSQTISDYQLRKELGIDYSELKGLRHTTIELYGFRSNFTMRIFWRDDKAIVRAVAARHGIPTADVTTLAGVVDAVNARRQLAAGRGRT